MLEPGRLELRWNLEHRQRSVQGEPRQRRCRDTTEHPEFDRFLRRGHRS